jgi:hypothetical protein
MRRFALMNFQINHQPLIANFLIHLVAFRELNKLV